MHILAVLGEDAPAWAGVPGPQYYPAWKQFVAAVVQHFAGKVDAWDVFNEVDVKEKIYRARAAAPGWDINVLQTAIETIRAHDPTGKIVCCSTGTLTWLAYDRRLLQSSVLSGVDIVSLHPYQQTPPELKQGALNYLESVNALETLLKSAGVSKPVWSTEANWLIGPGGARDVNSPGLTEQQQAEYLVRVNLLSASQGVKYFVHAPFYTFYHPQPFVGTWAAYAEMASIFPGGARPEIISSGPQVYGVSASAPMSGRVGALWSVAPEATVSLDGVGDYRFMDMYGNPLSINARNISLSPAPIYFRLSGLATSSPRVQILNEPNPQSTLLPQLSAWKCQLATTCTAMGEGRRIQASPKKWSSQLISPSFPVPSDTCQSLRIQISVEKGLVGISAIDGTSRKLIDKVKAYVGDVPAGQPQNVEMYFHTGSSQSAQIVLTNANDSDTESVFTVTERPRLVSCP